MDLLIRRVHVLARYGAWCGGVLLICAAFVIGVEVVIRKVFNMSIGGANELSSFALAISSAWAFSFTMLERAHVRVEILYVILPTRVCAVVDLLAQATVTVVMTILTWHGFLVFKNSWAMDSRTLTPLASPLAVPQFFWLAGLVFFVLVAALLLVRGALALVAGDWAMVQRIIGPRSVAQELEREIEQVRGRRGVAEANER